MKAFYIAVVLLLLGLLALACTAPVQTPTPIPTDTTDVDATLEARVAEQVQAGVQTAMAQIPTDTPEPTATSVPTQTPLPSFTPKPLPTLTPTREPTATPSVADWSGRLKPWTVRVTTWGGHGTGFFMMDPSSDADWYVVTNAHVVGSRRFVSVSWNYEGVPSLSMVRVMAVDEYADIALLDLSPDDFDFSRTSYDSGLTYLKEEGKGVRTATSTKLGMEVLALGYPEGGGGLSITRGVVSSDDVEREGVSWIKTDAAINPGNSGGPLMTTDGKIIGMNTWRRKDLENVGYALPISEIRARFSSMASGQSNKIATPTPRPSPTPPQRYLGQDWYFALLTWYEGGTYRYNVNEWGRPCIDRIWNTGYRSIRRYKDCEFKGYEVKDKFYVQYSNQYMEVKVVKLTKQPYSNVIVAMPTPTPRWRW